MGKCKKILGNPDDEIEISPKKQHELKGIIREYYVIMLDKDLVNEKYDRSVSLIFNENDFLVKISSNLKEINERGEIVKWHRFYKEIDD